MADKDTKMLEEAYMSQYLSSPKKIDGYPIYSQLENILEDVVQKKISKEQLVDKIKLIQEELVEIAEELRLRDEDELALRLVD